MSLLFIALDLQKDDLTAMLRPAVGPAGKYSAPEPIWFPPLTGVAVVAFGLGVSCALMGVRNLSGHAREVADLDGLSATPESG